jgi:hypothetical protein
MEPFKIISCKAYKLFVSLQFFSLFFLFSFLLILLQICSCGDSELQLIESVAENTTWSGTEADIDYPELQLGSGRKKLRRKYLCFMPFYFLL